LHNIARGGGPRGTGERVQRGERGEEGRNSSRHLNVLGAKVIVKEVV
jgi:hypothetical protein